MKYWLPLILATALLACKKPQGFEYRDTRNFKIDKLGFDKTTVYMELVYFNPNNFGVNLKHVDCDVYVNQNYVGKYLLDTLMHISRKSEFSIPSRMEVDMRNIYKNALNTLLSNDVLVQVKGNTKVGKAGIFVNVPFSYEGRHKFNLFSN
ncbi:LEA type 2 family protein [Foetidibacter luteolus]|uniref:LEA type 2 family protein n=1 Tax=Foetidibacter luteolus TaxID=2608880 RepID=UPI00129BD093|nr:LEA type 2 family protein [Foetidibacter luteolus]